MVVNNQLFPQKTLSQNVWQGCECISALQCLKKCDIGLQKVFGHGHYLTKVCYLPLIYLLLQDNPLYYSAHSWLFLVALWIDYIVLPHLTWQKNKIQSHKFCTSWSVKVLTRVIESTDISDRFHIIRSSGKHEKLTIWVIGSVN